MMYKSFDKKSTGSGFKNEVKQNQQLANELHKSTVYYPLFIIHLKTIFGVQI